MRIIIMHGINNIQRRLVSRSFSCAPVLATKKWRMSQGLAVNRTAEGVLTDGPDYIYLDGRPTPLLHKQKQRMLKQQSYASKIVRLCSELDFAKERHKTMLQASKDERQKIISDRLKPKGIALARRK